MKHPKNYYPVIAAAALSAGGFIPAGLGEEKEPVATPVEVKAVPQDPVVNRINEEIILPLNQQDKGRSSFFTRRLPTSFTNYWLAESTEKTSKGERHFQVMKTTSRLNRKKTSESAVFLKIRAIAKSGDLLAQHQDAWVDATDHPFLKLLPKTKPAPKITP